MTQAVASTSDHDGGLTGRRSWSTWSRWTPGTPWLLAPFLIGVVVLLVIPALLNLAFAFTNDTGLAPAKFTGLANVRRALADPLLAASLRASLIHAAAAVPLRLLAAAAFGLALAAPRRGNRLARAAVYVPSVLPELSLALVTLWAFNPVFGPVNGLLAEFGVTGPNWFATAGGARSAIVAMMLLPVGEGFLVVLAARRSLDPTLYEAARLDGASPRQQLRHVTLPQLAPLLVLLAVRDVILTLQVNVVPAYALTDGGPDSATLFLPVYIYDQAFELLGFGYAALLTLVLLLVTGSIVAGMATLARRRHWT